MCSLRYFEHVWTSSILWAISCLRNYICFRPFRLKYKLHSSLMPLSWTCSFGFNICTCLLKINNCKNHWGNKSKWERVVLYWYMQYFATLWTELQPDSHRLCWSFVILLWVCSCNVLNCSFPPCWFLVWF